MTKRTLQLNMDFGAYGKKGDKIKIQVDSEGTPLLKFWRRRVKEAGKNKCVEWVGAKPKRQKSKPSAEPVKTQLDSQAEEPSDGGSSDDNQST